jgi:ppGpp synthetase/RelA/SpoT-type nucleotidyltranferase
LFTILHISDTHFDVKARRSRIADALLRAARGQAWEPDLCLFSGDLTLSGAAGEFDLGGNWLAKLIAPPWRTKLFVVPGNHDLVRRAAIRVLREAHSDPATFDRLKESLRANLPHLDNFRYWHEKGRSLFGDRLLSDWGNPFGCQAIIDADGWDVNLVGLNTALLSCGDDDRGQLVQDIETLKDYIGLRSEGWDCDLLVGHHPLSWLVEWNQQAVKRLLNREGRAYFHGHQHAHSELVRGADEALVTFSSGAAYEASMWPQAFALYRLDFADREVTTQLFLYAPNAEEWVLDGSQSRRLFLPFPPESVAEKSSLRRQPRPRISSTRHPANAVSRTHPSSFEDATDPGSIGVPGDTAIIALHARRAVALANQAQQLVNRFLDGDPILAHHEYIRNSRGKTVERIVEKVFRNRQQGAVGYSVGDVTDICGFRYVTLFRSDVANVTDRLLQAISRDVLPGSPLRAGAGVEIQISSPRGDNLLDPNSMVHAIQEVAARHNQDWRVVLTPNAYGSSVYIIAHCAVPQPDNTEFLVAVEFQIRNAIEDIWAQIDHKLRYSIVRSVMPKNNNWHQHLNVLRAQFDACLQYTDVLSALSHQLPEQHAVIVEPPSTADSESRVVTSPERQLARLRNLPEPIRQEVERAYELWKSADASRQFGIDANVCRRAAESFAPLADGRPADIVDTALSRRLSHVAQMERAYLMSFAGDLSEAKAIYEKVLRDWPEDPTAHFRLGQVLNRLGEIESSIAHLEEAIRVVEAYPDVADRDLVHDTARLSLGYAYFLLFSREGGSPTREGKIAIERAIVTTRHLLAEHSQPDIKPAALNNLVYFAFEERNRWTDPKLWSVSNNEFQGLIDALESHIKTPEETGPSYIRYDTLARAYANLGNWVKARECAHAVCDALAKVALSRSEGKLKLVEKPPSYRWMSAILEYLKGEDEKDMLSYALNTISGIPSVLTASANGANKSDPSKSD